MFAYCFALERVTADCKGVTALEYAVIAAVIIVAIAGALETIGSNIGLIFTGMSGKI